MVRINLKQLGMDKWKKSSGGVVQWLWLWLLRRIPLAALAALVRCSSREREREREREGERESTTPRPTRQHPTPTPRVTYYHAIGRITQGSDLQRKSPQGHTRQSKVPKQKKHVERCSTSPRPLFLLPLKPETWALIGQLCVTA